VLAVQMPGQHHAPSHAIARDLAAAMFPDRFDWAGWQPAVAEPADYWRWLSPLGTVNAWETTYLHLLEPAGPAHPVRLFTQSTALRPILGQLSAAEQASFLARYDAALADAYPPLPQGGVLFAFRRVFFVATLAG